MNKTSVLFFLLVNLLGASAQADSLVWSQALPEENTWSRITFAGTLLVASENQLAHYSSVDGNRIWLRGDLAGLSQFNVQDVRGTPMLVVNQRVSTRPDQFRVLILNLMSGETVWDTGVIDGDALGAYPVPAENLLVFAAELPDEDGRESGTYLLSYALDSGEVLWRTRLGRRGNLPVHVGDRSVSKAKDLSGHPQPVVIGSSFILVAGDLIAIDLESGIEEWRFPLKASVSKLKNTYAQPLLVDGVLYAAGRSKVHAIDPTNGSEIWQAKTGRSAIPQLEVVGNLIVGRKGGTFSDGRELVGQPPYGAFAIDRSNGKMKWKWTKARDSITNLHVMPDEGIVLLADRTRLYALELEPEKKAKTAYREDLEFKRKIGVADVAAKGVSVVGGILGGGPITFGGSARDDPPLDIEAYGNRLIVRAQYHVLAFDLESHGTDWSIEFAPPGISALSLIAMGAVTATIIASNAAQSLSGDPNADYYPSSAMSSRLEDAVAARHAISDKARDVAFFLTKQDKNLSLVGINLNDGSVVGNIAMAETAPQFMIDAIAGRAYYFKNKIELLAYDF